MEFSENRFLFEEILTMFDNTKLTHLVQNDASNVAETRNEAAKKFWQSILSCNC